MVKSIGPMSLHATAGQSSLGPVIAGFVIMLLLMLAVTAIAVTHIRALSDELTAIVVQRNQKSALVAKLRGLNHARFQALRLAARIEDDFERDQELMRFVAMMGNISAARETFQTMPMEEDELAAWQAVRADLRVAEGIAEAIFDQLQRGRLADARVQLERDMAPALTALAAGWDQLLDLQLARNLAALEDARAARARAQRLTIALSAGALLMAAVIAVFVARRSRRLEKALFEAKEQAQVTLQAIGEAVVRFDRARQVTYVNPVAEQLLGVDAGDVVGRPFAEVVHLYERQGDVDLARALIEEVNAGRDGVLPDTALLRAQVGVEYEVEGQCSPVHDKDGRLDGGVLVLRDVSEARELQRKLHWQAHHDVMTGLDNRPAFEQRVERALTGQRRAEFPMSLLYIDLDHFKQVNDAAGHAAGDELLRQIGAIMQSRVRDTDVVARLGGDEFGVLLLACPDAMAVRIAENLRDAIAAHRFQWAGQTHGVGASIGVVHVPPLWSTVDECLAAADAACYRAKQSGRNAVVVHGGAA